MASLRHLTVLFVVLAAALVSHAADDDSDLLCIYPCKTCKDLKCTSCATNYHLDTKAGITYCAPDCNVDDCKNCVLPDTCILCKSGFYVNLRGKCVAKASEASAATQWVVLATVVLSALYAYAL
ncbi:hypothetical protein AGDE_16853 [Angomonas deanei]|uniref:Surface antigen-like protein n=1 Tax=Angomonas deanei TaxID=59799 RepID=A0A7G2CKH1_9TRYP|nr:hypothetical protein AGDE_16853 [Angomonas deanei]CAD2219895.1 hypothetical protein, conserved [Angomonas deanei]|eukprot:EPY16054.1 hypothetical protein AGDE_16853 [Angomonas deanei]